jgi:hypothetical protein
MAKKEVSLGRHILGCVVFLTIAPIAIFAWVLVSGMVLQQCG